MTDKGPPPGEAFQTERERLFLEIHELRQQRNDLMVRLIECQCKNRTMKALLSQPRVSSDSHDAVAPEAQDNEHE